MRTHEPIRSVLVTGEVKAVGTCACREWASPVPPEVPFIIEPDGGSRDRATRAEVRRLRLVLLGARLDVVVGEDAVGRYLADSLADLTASAVEAVSSPRHVVEVVVDRPGLPGTRAEVWIDGALVCRTAAISYAVGLVFWLLNRFAVVHMPETHVAFHAGAVAHAGVVLMLPASSGSGKSTLTAALVESGCDYGSDELAVVDPTTMRLLPYPKPISLDPGSWPLFPAVDPDASRNLGLSLRQWQVRPAQLRPGAAPAEGTVLHVVVPRYVAGGPLELTPLARARALVHLAGQSFLPEIDQRARLEGLAAIVRRLTCWQLTLDDPRAAAVALRRVIEAGTDSRVDAEEAEGVSPPVTGRPPESIGASLLAGSFEGNRS